MRRPIRSTTRLRATACARMLAPALAVMLVAGVPAAPASPGVPDPPVALFGEDFENVPGAASQTIQAYDGAPPFAALYRPTTRGTAARTPATA